MYQLSLSDVLTMTPEQCAEYVGKHRIADPHADTQQLGDLADPTYRVLVKSWRANAR